MHNYGKTRIQNLGLLVLFTILAVMPALEVDFSTPLSYGGSQDNGTAIVYDDGNLVSINGNSWKAFALPSTYEITAETQLVISVDVITNGEIIGVGLVNSINNINASRSFQLSGTQNWGIQDYRTNSNGRVTIPVGQHFTGQASYLVLIGDDDRSTPRQRTRWDSAVLKERAPLLRVPVVEEDATILVAYDNNELDTATRAMISGIQNVTDDALDDASGYQLFTDVSVASVVDTIQRQIDIGRPGFYWSPVSIVGRDALLALDSALQSAEDAGLSTYDGGAAAGAVQSALRTMNALYVTTTDG